MTTDFSQILTNIRDRAATQAMKYGFSKIRRVWIITTFTDSTQQTVLIQPYPFVEETKLDDETLPPSFSSFQGTVRILSVKGVSKNYTRASLEADNIQYQVENFTQGEQNFNCFLVGIKDDGLTWELTLVQRIAEEQVYDGLYDS